jgi:hypothetical protein
MNALRLDYQTSSQRHNPLSLLLLVIGCTTTIVAVAQYSSIQEKIAGLSSDLEQARMAHENQEQRAANSSKKGNPSNAMDKARHEVVEKLNLPWVPLFKSIENAQEPKVFLLAIEPNAKTQAARLTAEADTLPRALSYLDRLQRQSALKEVTLIEHEIEMDAPGQPVKFTLNLSWSAAQ